MSKEKVKFRATKPDLEIPIRTKSIVYGASKVGKSPVIATIPNAYIIDTERGMRHYKKDIAKNNSVVFESTDIEEIREEILKLETYEHPYTTLVIDSLSYLSDVESDKWHRIHKRNLQQEIESTKSEWHRQKKKRELEINNFGYGYWSNLNGEMRKIQYLLGSKSKIDMNVVVVAYEDAKEQEDSKTRTKEHIIRPALPKKSEHLYDYCIRIYKVGSTKKNNTSYSTSYASVDGKGDPIPDFEWTSENLKKYILKDFTQTKNKELADKKTIDFILNNKEQYVDAHQESRWLSKLDITSWDQVPKEAAEKIIDYIEKKKNKKSEEKKDKDKETKELENEDINQ